MTAFAAERLADAPEERRAEPEEEMVARRVEEAEETADATPVALVEIADAIPVAPARTVVWQVELPRLPLVLAEEPLVPPAELLACSDARNAAL